MNNYQKEKIHKHIDNDIELKAELLMCDAVELIQYIELEAYVKDRIKCGQDTGGNLEGMKRLLEELERFGRIDQLLYALEKNEKKRLAAKIKSCLTTSE